jgi:uncharacterized protein (DUF433 family)
MSRAPNKATKLPEANLTVMMGKPVIAGTRITAELLPDELAAGASDCCARLVDEVAVE